MDNACMPSNSTSLEISERYEEGHYDQVALGLTKREHFAGLAMQGMISNPNLNEGCGYSSDQLVSLSVQFSDALLKELDK